MKAIKILLTSLMFVTPPVALATESIQEESPQVVKNQKVSGFYLGAGYGSQSYGVYKNNDDGESHYKNKNSEGNSLKVYGGYQFNKVIAVEATYTDYSDIEGYVYYILSGDQAVKQSPHSFSVAANAGYSFDNGLRPFALIGLSYLTLNSSHPDLFSDNRIAVKSGLGVDYAPLALKGVQLRVAYEGEGYFSSNEDVNIDVFSLAAFYAGISYKF